MTKEKEQIKQVETEETAVEVQESKMPAEMIQIAVEKGADLEKLEKLLTLQERWDANEAKKAYHRAMAEFKASPPEILKDKSVNYKAGGGTTAYRHASLANVTEKINAALSKHGLSASWRVAQNGGVSVTCKITHNLGHSEETTLTAPADSSGSKNNIQAIGSTITYLERYSLLALTGLAAFDDDDGQASEVMEYIDEQQLSTILDYVDNKKVNKEKFLKYMGIESIEKMPKTEYNRAIKALEAKK